jgi:MFS family permease
MPVRIIDAAASLSSQPNGSPSTRDHIFISVLWLALYAQWVTVVPIIVPDQIAGMLGPHDAAKEGISGSVIAMGAAVALLIAPIAGALSDRARAPRGRRRPFLLSGILGSCVGLFILACFGPGSSVLLYSLAFLHLQFWWNWAAGPYAGLIPDVVPAEAQSKASGWMNVATILGTILGNVLLSALYRPDRVLPVIVAYVVINLACLVMTLRGVREPVADGVRDRVNIRAFVGSFYLDPRTHANLYWVLVTRLVANMGIWSVFAFLLFYIETVLGIERSMAVRFVPALLGAGAILAIPASLIGVRFADRFGIVQAVWITSCIMAAAARLLRADRAVPQIISGGTGRPGVQRRLWCIWRGRLGLGAESTSREPRRRQGYGHLAYFDGAAPNAGSRRNGLAHLGP